MQCRIRRAVNYFVLRNGLPTPTGQYKTWTLWTLDWTGPWTRLHIDQQQSLSIYRLEAAEITTKVDSLSLY